MYSITDLFSQKQFTTIVSLPQNRLDLAYAAIKGGADALKFHINVSHRASGNDFAGIEEYTETFKEIRKNFKGPMGIVLGEDIDKINTIEASLVKETGFNYFSLYAKDISSKWITQQDIERTVAIDSNFKLEEIQIMDFFNVDAVELSIINKEQYGEKLNLEDLIKYKSFRERTRLPLIVPTQKKIDEKDIPLLKEIGINAVMLGVVSIGDSEKSIYENVSRIVKNNK